MRYVSTRGAAPVLEFGDVLLAGLADDGGLYVPEHWPKLPDALPTDYEDVAVEVMWPYVEGSIDRRDFVRMVHDAYSHFEHEDVCPLVELDEGFWILELFHGPTLAFKDVALQLVGRLFDHELERRGQRATIVVATSGDTGSAAIAACAARERLDIVVLHPAGRVSEVQRRQMTTVDAANVHNVAVDGTFDDCQDLVKAMFADRVFRERVGLAAMNSINWARVMAQIVYYVTSTEHLGTCGFAVPSGNFGNVLSGWAARRCGAPIAELVIGSNVNDILTRWLETGVLEMGEVVPTISPSMDIGVSSNLERLLYELYDHDGQAIADLMATFRETGRVDTGETRRDLVSETFTGSRLTDDETRSVICDVYETTGSLIDPHTAVGVGAARRVRRHTDVPMVCLATAHPSKFGDAVLEAAGVEPDVPERLAACLEAPERYDELPNDLDQVKQHVLDALT